MALMVFSWCGHTPPPPDFAFYERKGVASNAVVDKNLFQFNSKQGQFGFSLIEMTIVLAILAIGATTAMRVASNKMEQTITSRTVSDLSIAAEAAYECYVAGTCATSDSKGWTFGEGWKADYLPETFPYQFAFTPLLLDDARLKAEIRVDMEDAGRALRVARAFGSQAKGEGSDVVLTLGIPGTERAFSAAMDQMKKEIRGDFPDNCAYGIKIVSGKVSCLPKLKPGVKCVNPNIASVHSGGYRWRSYRYSLVLDRNGCVKIIGRGG